MGPRSTPISAVLWRQAVTLASLSLWKPSGWSTISRTWRGALRNRGIWPQRPVSPIDMIPTLSCPLLALFGEEDPNASPAHAARLQAELDTHGKPSELRMYRHAGHAFFADYRPSYRAAAAQDMWHRVLVFYEQYLQA